MVKRRLPSHSTMPCKVPKRTPVKQGEIAVMRPYWRSMFAVDTICRSGLRSTSTPVQPRMVTNGRDAMQSIMRGVQPCATFTMRLLPLSVRTFAPSDRIRTYVGALVAAVVVDSRLDRRHVIVSSVFGHAHQRWAERDRWAVEMVSAVSTTVRMSSYVKALMKCACPVSSTHATVLPSDMISTTLESASRNTATTAPDCTDATMMTPDMLPIQTSSFSLMMERHDIENLVRMQSLQSRRRSASTAPSDWLREGGALSSDFTCAGDSMGRLDARDSELLLLLEPAFSDIAR
mmetsp:Transcript_3781/g.9209  ORF Transcript_3781/g.9209 Transcript_3781/m.9209 type:complete len:290 (-) Transcript_3781:58-927(-)